MSHLIRFFEAANMNAPPRRRQVSYGMAARHLRRPGSRRLHKGPKVALSNDGRSHPFPRARNRPWVSRHARRMTEKSKDAAERHCRISCPPLRHTVEPCLGVTTSEKPRLVWQ